MIDIVAPAVAAVISLILSGAYLKRKELKENPKFSSLLPKGKAQWFVFAGIAVSLCAAVGFSCTLYSEVWFRTAQKVAVIAFLWVLAYIDSKEYIIPNKILLAMLIVRLLFFVIEAFSEPQEMKTLILSDLIACAAVLVLLCLMRLISKGSVGFGDIKLFALLGLYFGIQGTAAVLFMSFAVSFFVSVFLLISKRKQKKDKIAFAPFILIGTFISIIFFGV